MKHIFWRFCFFPCSYFYTGALTMKNTITSLMGLFIFAAMLAWASTATADIGLSGDVNQIPGQDQSFDLGGSSFINIGISSPFEIYFDPTKGPWDKTFTNFTWPLHITENIHVSQGVAWTDWDEKILTDGWIWASNPSPQVDLTGNTIGQVIGDISADGHTVVFDFSPALQPCTYLTITKTLVWTGGGDPGVVPGPVTIAEWPTVPEPGTLVLLLAGGVALAATEWRRRK
jgi:hypothetical protein